jgi:hypothetical protein
MVVDLHVQLGLDRFEEIMFENGRLFTLKDVALKGNFADIEAVTKQMRERASRKRNASRCRTNSADLVGFRAGALSLLTIG